MANKKNPTLVLVVILKTMHVTKWSIQQLILNTYTKFDLM